MRTSAVFLLLCSCSQGVSSFSLNTPNVKSTKLAATKQHSALPEQLVRAFGVAAAFLTLQTTEVSAATPTLNDHVSLSQPSILLSAEIKTMDFALPSSYDSISDVKSSDQEALGVKERGGGPVKKAAKPKKVKSSSTSDGGGSGPSLKLSTAPTAEEKEAALAARKAREEEAKQKAAAAEEAKKEAKKQQLLEQQAEQERKAEEREAKRLQKKAEKEEEAANQEKEKNKTFVEQTSSKATFTSGDFVDMGLPSYGSPNPDGKRK